jgi:hypothetical protein
MMRFGNMIKKSYLLNKNVMEIWKDIKGYEGLYQVSNYGNVKSLPKNVSIGKGAIRIQPEKILKNTFRNAKTYLCVCLYKNTKPKLISVHRLVADAFLNNLNNYPIVMHKDDNPQNNHINNLMWGTHSENNKGRNQYTIK